MGVVLTCGCVRARCWWCDCVQLVEEGLSLDPWPLMYAEVVDIVHPADSMSRIALSVILQLANELLPLYIYNDTTQRFVVSPLTKASESHAATVCWRVVHIRNAWQRHHCCCCCCC